jgi:hypothetical protein
VDASPEWLTCHLDEMNATGLISGSSKWYSFSVLPSGMAAAVARNFDHIASEKPALAREARKAVM